MIAKCPCCNHTEDLGVRFSGKLVGALAPQLLGKNAHWLAKLLLSITGFGVGHWIDRNVLPNCPSCRVALQIVEPIL